MVTTNRQNPTILGIYTDELCNLANDLPEFTKFVKNNKGKLNEQDADGRSILHHLYLNKCDKNNNFHNVTKLLIDNGANFLLRDNRDIFAFEDTDNNYHLDTIINVHTERVAIFGGYILPDSYFEELCASEKFHTCLPCFLDYFATKDALNEIEIKYFFDCEVKPPLAERNGPFILSGMLKEYLHLEFLEMGNNPHTFTGNNLIHKLASTKKEIKLDYYAQKKEREKIFSNKWTYTEVKANSMNIVEAILEYVLIKSDMDPYLINYENKQPFEIAYHRAQILLYNKFIRDIIANKFKGDIYPFIEYGVRAFYKDKELHAFELFKILKTTGYPVYKTQATLKGDSVLHLLLQEYEYQTKIKRTSNKDIEILFSIIEDNQESIDIPNYEGVTIRKLLNKITKVTSDVKDNKISSYITPQKKTKENTNSKVTTYYEDLLKQKQAKLVQLKETFDSFKNGVSTNLLTKQNIDLQQNKKILQIESFLNLKKWFIELEKSIRGTFDTEQNKPSFTTSQPQDEPQPNKYIYEFVLDNLYSFLDNYNFFKEEPLIYIHEIEASPTLYYKNEFDNIDIQINTINKKFKYLQKKIFEKPSVDKEQNKKIEMLFKTLNILEIRKNISDRLKVIEKTFKDYLASKNKMIFEQEEPDIIKEYTQYAPKEFKELYTSLRNIYISNKADFLDKANNKLIELQKNCVDFYKQANNMNTEIPFCKDTFNYDFSQEYEFF